MFTRIWNWLVSVERHAVDSIVGDFHAIVDRLEASAAHHYDVAVDAAIKATHFDDLEAAARTEAARAINVANKVRALVS